MAPMAVAPNKTAQGCLILWPARLHLIAPTLAATTATSFGICPDFDDISMELTTTRNDLDVKLVYFTTATPHQVVRFWRHQKRPLVPFRPTTAPFLPLVSPPTTPLPR